MNIQSSFTVYSAALHALILNSLLLAYFWLGASWIDSIDSISANKRFSSSKTSSRKPYSNSKQQEKRKHSAETTINFSGGTHERGKRARRAGQREAHKTTKTQRQGPGHPVAGSQRKPKTTGAHTGRKKNKAPSGSDANRETQKGGGGAATTREKPTAKQKTQNKRKRTESREAGGKKKKTQGTRGRKPEKAGDNGGADKRRKKNTGHRAAATKTARHRRGGRATTREQPTATQDTQKGRERTESREARGQQNKQHTALRPRAPGAGSQRKQEAKGCAENNNGKKTKGGGRANKGPRKGQPQPGGGQAKQKDKAAKGKGEAHQNAPGRPARPTRPGRTSTCTHARDPGVASSDLQGEVLASTRNSPGAPAESPIEQRTVRETERVSDQVHTRQPPQRTQPKTDRRDPPGTTPSRGPERVRRGASPAPFLGGARGRYNEPGSRPASACPAQPPSKAGGASSQGGEKHHGVGKADQSTESDRTGRGAAHHAGLRSTPERHAAGHIQGTGRGAKQRRPPDAAILESVHNTQRTTARGQVPSNNSRRPDGGLRARQRTQPLPAAEQPPSTWTRVCP